MRKTDTFKYAILLGYEITSPHYEGALQLLRYGNKLLSMNLYIEASTL